MRNTGLEEAQAGIKIAGRNNNLRCADDITLMAESEEELKRLLMKMKAPGKLERQCDEEGLFPIIQQNSVRLLFWGL